ncbi:MULTISPECIES: bifunctional NAD(P)H-dependent oxidoreductase/GNAT family N-acetyltransferase [Streptomyces]|uniref:Bifunctional protein n=1 Tax=Streptomyces coelicolor (strain ATCC BAA-471 / A3(2) / M145) TaxID=100226 RepID=Q9AJY7_STRCO|nr:MULTISPECIES: bifunctional NAD(P)H-dependent oxidoreductase/GNAT family N-acetyltransferase [Streptomyces]MDX2930715.1 bifunctional NAD(P)H-dependent oxidoreductase/GNAT family N-acetyltransferase [Streptomyces sp. NRRL_B-16638]MDX3406370.1 bifunctional NAD(P)H-dependent oxidoreductase/GNAT family N-acetyltransferase [Streptomyces sp. ME02-6977A]MYU47242.1 GNAT family N-acetyltransferase [Streptomyces sp. SID7813]NSL80455.1 GNAT family N-acetyltransferase [Streptomyces coelicolor]QFI47453.1
MSTKRTRVLVLICSTRPGALGPAVGKWLTETLAPSTLTLDAALVPLALGDLRLPFLDEEEHPSTGVYRHEHTRRWSAIVDEADGFVVVTPEYNYGMPATLKNALDYLGPEWAWKPVGFVSYGNTSAGTRAVQHAKQVMTTLRLVPLGSTVAIRITDAMREDRFQPRASLSDAAEGLLAELVRVAHALTPLRERERVSAVAGPVAGSYARHLTPDDAPEVTVLQRCCWAEEAVANSTLAIPALHESPHQVRAWLTDWHATGLWQDGRLLGMVRTRRSGAELHIGRLAVVPDLRGVGLGRWLLRMAESAGEGCRRIVLSTGAASSRNLALYESQGYAPLRVEVDAGVVHLAKTVPS